VTDVKTPVMELFEFHRNENYGTYSAVARHVGATPTSVREWAMGITYPSEKYWLKLDEFFEQPGFFETHAGETREAVSDRLELKRLRAVVAAQGRAILLLAEQVAALPGVGELPADVLAPIRAVQ